MRREDIFHLCLQNLQRRKSRTFLTVLGVLIGCCSIVIMVSLGIGMKEAQEKMLAEMGDLTVITVSAPQNGNGKVKLDDKAVKAFQSLAGVTAVTPKLEFSDYTLKISAGTGGRYVNTYPGLVGVDTSAIGDLGYKLVSGNSIAGENEVLVGQYFAYNFQDTLRPQGYNTVDRWNCDYDKNYNPINVPDPYFNPVGMPLTLQVTTDSGSFTVTLKAVGMTKEDYAKGFETSEGMLMRLEDLKAIIAKAQGNNRKAITYGNVLVKCADISQVGQVEKDIKAMGYSTYSMESIRSSMEKEARQKQLMLGGLGAISLFVAALGITNTMIMSISERTREIGIMKALGCFVRDIRVSFLAEAGAIGLLGGVIGCVVSFLISVIINLFGLGPPSLSTLLVAAFGMGTTRTSVIPWWLFLFAVVFSVAIGLVSGYYPANKAVRISALEAIKSSE